MTEVAIRTILAQDNAVSELADDRVFLLHLPQNERQPSIVVTLIDAIHPHTLTAHAGWVNGRVQIVCFGPTLQDAKEVARVVKASLDGYSGEVEIGSDEVIADIGWIKIDSERDLPQAPGPGQGKPAMYGVSIDVTFLSFDTV